MPEEVSDETTLAEAYSSGLRAKEELEQDSLMPGTPESRALYNYTLQRFCECQAMVEKLGLFSSNETIDDLSTKTIEYMTLDVIVAQLLESCYIGPPANAIVLRFHFAKVSCRKFIEYFCLLEDYGLLSPAYKGFLANLFPDGEHIYLNRTFMWPRRNAEAVRFIKRELARQKRTAESRLESRVSTLAGMLYEDEEMNREINLLRVQYNEAVAWEGLQNVVHELAVVSRVVPNMQNNPVDIFSPDAVVEIPAKIVFRLSREAILLRAKRQREDMPPERLVDPAEVASTLLAAPPSGMSNSASQVKDYSTKVDLDAGKNMNKIFGENGRVLQPFVLTNSKDQVARQVFGTGQTLPTMTVDEFVEQELKNGGIAAPSKPKEVFDEDDIARADEQTMKARQWDDFKEANPLGSGNTMNRG